MPLKTIINLTQNREKDEFPVVIEKGFSIDVDTFNCFKEFNKITYDIDLGLNIYKYIKTHSVDYELINVINNQFNNLVKLDISDYKGLTNKGMKEMALENLWDGICDAFVKMWEYIRDALTGLLESIKKFFNYKSDERSAKVADRLTKVFQDSDEYGLDDISLNNIPEKEQLKIRLEFYESIIVKINKLYEETKGSLYPTNPNDIFETIDKGIKNIDKKNESGITIDIKSNKISINKLNVHTGFIKDFKWLVKSEDKIDDVQKKFLKLKKKYEDTQKTIQDILTISKTQISNIKSKNVNIDEKALRGSIAVYSALVNIIGNVLPSFIKDALAIDYVCEQIVKGIENHKQIKAGYENKTKVF